jgi:hypothetical protein
MWWRACPGPHGASYGQYGALGSVPIGNSARPSGASADLLTAAGLAAFAPHFDAEGCARARAWARSPVPGRQKPAPFRPLFRPSFRPFLYRAQRAGGSYVVRRCRTVLTLGISASVRVFTHRRDG